MGRNLATAVFAVLAIMVGSGAASGGSSSQPPPGQQPPVNQTLPSVSGSAQVGGTLTAAPGTWTGNGIKYADQWLRCDSSGASCNTTGGAGDSSYTLVSGDAGATLRVVVVASNQNGSASSTSAPSAVVAAPPAAASPTITTAPAATTTTATTTTATTTTATTAPTYSSSRYVYCFGDPAYLWPGESSSTSPGWSWLNTATDSGSYYGFGSSMWERDAAGTSNITPQRIFWDDSQDVMQSVTGSYGQPGTSGVCHTAAVEVQPTDRTISSGSVGQGSVMRINPDHFTDFGRPSPSPQQSKEWWYGFAVKSNAGYQPYGWSPADLAFGNWNTFGLQFHVSGGWDAGFGGPLGMGACTLQPVNSADRFSQPNGAFWYKGGTGLTYKQLDAPRLCVQIIGGPNNTSTDDATHTNRTIIGPVLQAGHRYRVAYRVKWDAYQAGELEWWVDGVQYGQLTGISTLFRNVSGVDNSAYPQMLNYRHQSTTLPTSIIYYGGFIRGSTMADVTIP
jgi:hypothetical protein